MCTQSLEGKQTSLTLLNKTLQGVSASKKNDKGSMKQSEGKSLKIKALKNDPIRHDPIHDSTGKRKKSKWAKIFKLPLSKSQSKESSHLTRNQPKKTFQNITKTSEITRKNKKLGSFSEDEVNDEEEFFFLLPSLEYQKSYESSLEKIYSEIKKQMHESLTHFENQLNQLNQCRSEFFKTKGPGQYMNLHCGEHTFPISKMKKILDQLLDTNTIAHVVFDLEAKNLEQAVTWEKINAPIYLSVLNMLEQNITEALKEESKCTTYINIHTLTQSINKMRSNILQVVFSSFEVEDYVDLPKCLKRTTPNVAGHICLAQPPETLKEAVECVLDDTPNKQVGEIFKVSDEEELKQLENKLKGRWGSCLLFERWVQESTRWHWLDIYGRRDYLDKQTTLRQFINMKRNQFEKDLDDRLSQLWLGCLQEYNLLSSKHISAVAFSTVSLIENHIRLVSPLWISRYLMEMEDYRSQLLRYLFSANLRVPVFLQKKSHGILPSSSHINLRGFLTQKKHAETSVNLEKTVSDLSLLKKKNLEQELFIEQKAKEDEEKGLALKAALQQEKERYTNLQTFHSSLVESIQQGRNEQDKLQVELKSLKKKIKALEISVNKKNHIKKEDADLFKASYFKASQDLDSFKINLSKIQNQIFHDSETVNNATVQTITNSNSESGTTENIQKSESWVKPDVGSMKPLSSTLKKKFLSKRLKGVMKFAFHTKKKHESELVRSNKNHFE